MDPELFAQLYQSLKEAKAIRAGELKAGRRFHIGALDVKAYSQDSAPTDTNASRTARAPASDRGACGRSGSPTS